MSDGEKFEIVFLLGAGASKPAKVPTTKEFVQEFLAELRHEKKRDELKAVKQIIEILNKNLKKKRKKVEVDIEILLEVLEALETKEDNILLYFYENLDKNFLLKGLVEKTHLIKDLKDFIVEKTTVDKEEIHYLYPLKDFIKESRPLRILTVNYDTAIEQFCEEYKIPYTDGFDLYWNPSNFDDEDKYDVHLYKLHGSITWYQTDRKNYLKSLVKPEGNKISLITKEEARSLILYPAQKWFYSDPILELLLKARKILENNDVKVLIIIGYSFRDDHIREILWNAARKNRDLTVFLITKNPLEIYEKRLKYYEHGATKIESSLKDRVICLPYDIKKVLPDLNVHFIRHYRAAYKNAKEIEKTVVPIDGAINHNILMDYMRAGHIFYIEKILEKKREGFRKNHYPIFLDALLNIHIFYDVNEAEAKEDYLNVFKEDILNLLEESVTLTVHGFHPKFEMSLALSEDYVKTLKTNGSDRMILPTFKSELKHIKSRIEVKKRYLFRTTKVFRVIESLIDRIINYLTPLIDDKLAFNKNGYYNRIKDFVNRDDYYSKITEIEKKVTKDPGKSHDYYDELAEYLKTLEIKYIKKNVLEM